MAHVGDDSGRLAVALVLLAVSLAGMTTGASARVGDDSEDEDDGSFGLTAPVLCKEIRGYENFDELPVAALTKDEKLLVYFRPRHFKTVRKGEAYEAHLTQEGRIRRRGQKAVLWSKKNLLDYTATSPEPPSRIYLRNSISLKELAPGEYDSDVVLRDEIGRSPPGVRSLPFKVVPAPPEGAK